MSEMTVVDIADDALTPRSEMRKLFKEHTEVVISRLDMMEARIVAIERGAVPLGGASMDEVRQATTSTRNSSSALDAAAAREVPPAAGLVASTKKYDAFISHAKKISGSEQKALMISDFLEEAGMKSFIDLQDLVEISREQLVADVKASRTLITVIAISAQEQFTPLHLCTP